jgi:hypothetical protein
MKINLIFKNFVILICISASLSGSTFVNARSKDKDFKNKYGVQLVLAK